MPGLVPEATGQPGGGGMGDPLGMANSLMDFQNKSNQNKKFQAEFMANQALGEIIAHAPSLEEGATQAMANPLIAGFGQEGLTSLRNMIMVKAQTGMIGQQTAGMKMTQGRDAFQSVATAALQAADDPVNWNKYIDSSMKGVDPSVMSFVGPRVAALKEGIAAKIQGLDMNNPAQREQAQKFIQSSVAGAYIGANGDPSRLSTVLPTTKVDEPGNVIRVPSVLGAGRGQAPSIGTTAAAPAGAAPAGAPAPIVTNSSSGEQYPLHTEEVGHYMNLGPDGKPAIGMYGRPVINPAFVESDKKLQTDHDGPELISYNADKGMLSSIAQMQSAADDLTAAGGFTVPGFMGVARGQIASAIETVENITGKKFTGDASMSNLDLAIKNSDVQTINKWHGALSFQLKNMLESTGARGLGVLMEASSAVPSMENTPLAFKVLTSGLTALANWDIGKYEYKEAYRKDPYTGGSLLGSDLSYNKVSSPLDAAKNELGKIGVVLDGSHLTFSDDKHLLRAYETGLFGARKKRPTDKDGPAEKAMDAMYDTMHPELKNKK